MATFKDAATEDIYRNVDSKKARKAIPAALVRVARRKLTAVYRADALVDLASAPGNGLEALKGDRAGQHSIRVNAQYRVCFVWTEQGAEDIEIVDYH